MNILFVSCTYPCPLAPQRGVFNQSLVEQLSVMHDVKVIAPVPWTQVLKSKLSRQKREKSSTHNPVQSRVSKVTHPTFFYPPKVLRPQYERFFWRSIRSSYLALTRKWTPDLVIGYWTHPDGDAVVRIAEQHGVPSAIVVGGTDVRIRTRQSARRRKIISVLNRCSQVITVSNELKTRIVRHGIPQEKVHVIYRGTDPTVFSSGSSHLARESLRIPQDENLVLWVGRMVDVKRPLLALESFARFSTTTDQTSRLVMIGDGNLRSAVVRAAKRLGIEKQVQVLSNRSQIELAEWYRAANLVLLTSRSEGIPNVLVEAAACDTPFVATNVGGVSEVARPGIDRLVESASPLAIATTMSRAISESDSSIPDGSLSQGRDRVQPQTMGDKILRLFEKHDDAPMPKLARPRDRYLVHRYASTTDA